MKNNKLMRLAGVCLVCALAAFAVVNFAGCEEATGLTDLTISPQYVQFKSFAVSSNYVDFVASTVVSNDLALPIAWSVSKPELGYISESAGYRARYVRYQANGDNVITAIDQYGNQGSAMVKQW